MKKEVDLSIIILSYNTLELLRECLESVKSSETTGFSFETIVVDNASTDVSVKMVKEEFPTVRLIQNRTNLGFAKANNLGIKKSLGRYMLLLNPDTIVQSDTLETMIDFMDENPEVGVATCRVELTDGRLDQACHRGFPTAWNALSYFSGLAKVFPKSKFFASYSLTYLPLNKIHEIDSGCGAFLIVRRKAGEQVGWFDEDYFWYGEDLDFCYRLKERGWKVMFVPTTRIIHYKGAASGIKKASLKVSTATKETRIKAVRASTQVMRIFFRKHYRDKYPKFIFWLVMLGILLLEKIRLTKIK